MNEKSDSDVTSNSNMEQSSMLPPPDHFHFHSYLPSPTHDHSRHLSASSSWTKLYRSNNGDDLDDEDSDDDDDVNDSTQKVWSNVCFFLVLVLLFTLFFSFILWGVSKCYQPHVILKSIVLENLNVQLGIDRTGIHTYMLSLNSTVTIMYRNPATFFNYRVTSTPLQLSYYEFTLASAQIQDFYQDKNSQRKLAVVVFGHQVPLYGAMSILGDSGEDPNSIALPLDLTFMVRSRAFILGKLVTSNFYRRIKCSVTLHGNQLGKPLNLTDACLYT